MTTTLNQKPVIGVIAGAFSGLMYFIKSAFITLFTGDDVLKWVAGFSIWIGFGVAILTAYLKILDVRRRHHEIKILKSQAGK